MSRDLSRLGKRLARLNALASVHQRACRSRINLHAAAARRVTSVIIRPGLIVADHSYNPKPPIARLISPHGIALQLYLVALFEAQCRRSPGKTPVNDRVLRATERNEVGWCDLIASVSVAHPNTSVHRATENDNRLRQVKSALRTLEINGLVAVPGMARRNDRYEHFSICHESGSTESGEQVIYAVPRPGLPGATYIPVEFFLRGWVHVLTPAEIAVYLMLRHLATVHPYQHSTHGIYVAGSKREHDYGLSRDVYEAHRSLTSFGLLERQRDPRRWSGGGLKNYGQLLTADGAIPPHRFRVLDADELDYDALAVVRNRIEHRLSADNEHQHGNDGLRALKAKLRRLEGMPHRLNGLR